MESLFACCTQRKRTQRIHPRDLTYPDEKAPLQSSYYIYTPDDGKIAVDLEINHAAECAISVLQQASSIGTDLELELKSTVVRELGWWDDAVAAAALWAVERLILSGANLGKTMMDAYNDAVKAASEMQEFAGEFAKEHPVITGVLCTVIALGILYLTWPWILEVLGFGELGPIEGSWAALWQSRYGARVPVGSLFSFLQRLGMTVGK